MGRTKLGRALLGVLAGALCVAGCAAPDAVPSDKPDTTPPPDTLVKPGDVLWGQGFGSADGAYQRLVDLAFDETNSQLVLSMLFETSALIPGLNMDMPFLGYGSRDILVLKYSKNGTAPAWAVRMGDGSEQFGNAVTVDKAGNVFVAGGFDGVIDLGQPTTPVVGLGNYDAFIAKLDGAGQPLWLKSVGNTDKQFFCDAATDAEGNVYVVGYAGGGNDLDLGDGVVVKTSMNNDILVAKLSAGGQAVWAKRLGAAATDDPRSIPLAIDVASDGTVLVAGSMRSVLQAGDVDIPKLGDQDAFLLALDTLGNGLWGKNFGAPMKSQFLYGLTVDKKGRIAITGAFSGQVSFVGDGTNKLESADDADVFVASYFPNGEHQWSRRFGSPGNQVGRDVGFDETGNAYVSGQYRGVLEIFGNDSLVNVDVGGGQYDIFSIALDAKGETLWGSTFGDDGDQELSAMYVEPSGVQYLVGHNNKNIPLTNGEAPILSTGGDDGFVISLGPGKAPP